VETGTGVYRNDSDTGTDPNNPDSDGDAQSDGDEVLAGTDPLDPRDFFRIFAITRLPTGETVIFWQAYPGRIYDLLVRDAELIEGAEFQRPRNLGSIRVDQPGPVEFVDPPSGQNPRRFYRIVVRRQTSP
jgi:hypothetical protein